MSIATTLSSVAHAVLVMVRPGVWEAIFGARALVSPSKFRIPDLPMCISSGGVEAAVSITVCNTTVIIPAILRALSVGDPFMREDTVDPRFSTGFEIAPMTLTGIELSLPTSRATDSTELEGAIGTALSRQQHSVDFEAKDDRKRRLANQIPIGSPRDFKPTNVVLPIDESGVA